MLQNTASTVTPVSDGTLTEFVIAILSPTNAITAALLGGLTGAGLSILYWRSRARKENKSLILAICAELVLLFERCVLYYEQALITEKISFSALFTFTDAAILSRFASVCKDAAVVAAVVNLKSDYFQIGRHVDDAAKYLARAYRDSKSPAEEQASLLAGRHAQGTALAFFESSYETIKSNMKLVLSASQKVAASQATTQLNKKFKEMIERKEVVDKKRADAEASANRPIEGATSPAEEPKKSR